METATKNNYVKILRKEYDALMMLKKIIPLFHATRLEKSIINRGAKEVRAKQYKSWDEVKHELENTHN